MKHILNIKTAKNKDESLEIISILGKLLNNGFSILESLNCLFIIMPKSAPQITKINNRLIQGDPLYAALEEIKINGDILNQIMIAENNGNINVVIIQISLLLQEKKKQMKKVKLALAYPIMIFVFLLGVLFAIHSFGSDLAIDGSSDGYFDYFKIIGAGLIILICAIIGILYFKLKTSDQKKATYLKTKIPIVGKVYRKYYDYNLLYSLGMLVSNGAKLRDICEIKFAENSLYEVLGRELQSCLLNGISIKQYIQTNPLVADEINLLIETGSSHQNMGNELLALANLKYESLIEDIYKLIEKIQPLAFSTIGVLIVITYLRILLPVFGIMKGMN